MKHIQNLIFESHRADGNKLKSVPFIVRHITTADRHAEVIKHTLTTIIGTHPHLPVFLTKGAIVFLFP